jgi:hypothetical protein
MTILGTFTYTVTSSTSGPGTLTLNCGGVPPTTGALTVNLTLDVSETRRASGTQIGMDPACANYNFTDAIRP